MAIDYSLSALPKSRVKALDKEDQRKAIAAKDKAENAKAKKRAKGRCEVTVLLSRPICDATTLPYVFKTGEYFVDGKCDHKDSQTHHLIGGIGRRNKGKSILAEYKLRVCAECHAAITANVLRPTTAEHTAATVRFWRSR